MLEKNLEKRLIDLAEYSYKNSCFSFSNFLSEIEVSDFLEIAGREVFNGYKIFGGHSDSDRSMIRFGDENAFGYSEEFPISCIEISPLLAKFADILTHRDFLGSLMNLGISREKTGDIIICDNKGYLFVHNSLTDYICSNLEKVKHTNINASVCNGQDLLHTTNYVTKEILASSERIDGVISKVYNLSRNEALNLFCEHKVFVNSRVYENNSYIVKTGDLISVRGYGKFKYCGVSRITRSEKKCITVILYA